MATAARYCVLATAVALTARKKENLRREAAGAVRDTLEETVDWYRLSVMSQR